MPEIALWSEELRGREVTEVVAGSSLRNRPWEERSPGLVCGITVASAGTFSLGAVREDEVVESYSRLGEALGFGLVAVPYQVHGCDVVRVAAERARAGAPLACVEVSFSGRCDGLVTGDTDLLLASTAADCVPVYLLDPGTRSIGLVHAGWRGVAGGILERGLERLCEGRALRHRVRVHLGPAICGACYEVDRPVLDRFGVDAERARLDLRGILVSQALRAGVQESHITVSRHCTSCGETDLHSHRASGGQAGRMAAFVGFRVI